MKKLNWVVLVGTSVVAVGCGQKGPLYLPDKNASVVTRPGNTTATTPPATTPPASAPARPEDKKKDDDQSAAPKN
jgi:predicted small lipoprotein YifL